MGNQGKACYVTSYLSNQGRVFQAQLKLLAVAPGVKLAVNSAWGLIQRRRYLAYAKGLRRLLYRLNYGWVL